MTESKRVSAPWIDPDDAPDLSEADLSKGQWRVGERVLTQPEGMAALKKARRGRPPAANPREPVTLRLDAQTLARWRASGKGWQTRAAAALAAMAPPAT
ncbi:BrnA antitoxin family protein [Sphaerotilus mobilis]|uniref:Uncharacterized protein (DUF4415 family) n=1 Tax=Sphaerotilus mobilis TaxID=47994 RepID=A0A4Q7LS60_9BURK|nr:BrnA antitoxin family protein [Sphaerotilus mobilis]RZS57142.1 uncharacterized protein (DUF4415 family) [Sphaerotilus mobilis]